MTPAATPVAKLKLIYEMAEQRYLRSLPPEHFMEATAQATQRKITLESFDLIHAARPDVQCFNELLVQYPGDDEYKPGGVVPDNMIVVHPEPILADGSFNLPLQPVGPFLVMEYVSKGSKRKDYEDNIKRYEQAVKVPYYLLFYPDHEELTLFRAAGGRYAAVPPNAEGRLAVPELDLEVGLLDGWARYWFRGELLPLPGDLWHQLTAEQDARRAAEHRADAADAARVSLEAELARLRVELARAKGQS